jgi:tRNA dimethylallyltransferase
MRALGLRPLMAHIRGEATLEAAITAGKEETRRYIKRQETWVLGNMKSWHRTFTQ